jgi:site-specific DNA-methyltransferase (adenine-specific)
MSVPINQIICGDCLEVMKDWPDGCVDLVLTDPPYGTTACEWDSIIPLEPAWEVLKWIIKPNGAIVMTGAQPFTTTLIASNMKAFKYCWVWEKSRPTGHLNANRMPMKNVEDIVVFYDKQATYNPQMTQGKPNHVAEGTKRITKATNNCYGTFENSVQKRTFTKYPKQILQFQQQDPTKIIHPTQKPVALMEYLIKTYTNEGEIVIDFAMGSGTTCVAAKKLGRKYIGIDISEEYCQIARERLKSVDTGVPVKEARRGQKALFE